MYPSNVYSFIFELPTCYLVDYLLLILNCSLVYYLAYRSKTDGGLSHLVPSGLKLPVNLYLLVSLVPFLDEHHEEWNSY